jgi:hypothetical protein
MNLNEVAISKISKRGRVPIPLQNMPSQVQDIEATGNADSFLPPTQKSPISLPNSGLLDTLEDWSASPKKVFPKRDQVF